MPNYTFKMGRLFIDVHYDAALLWIERCNDSRVFSIKYVRPECRMCWLAHCGWIVPVP